MSITPVNSGNNYVSQVQPQPQPRAEREAENKVAEEAKRAAVAASTTSAAPKPTVNTQGQTVGTIVNVQA